MKTIADFKRRVVVGAKVHAIFHKEYNGRDEKGMPLFKDRDMGVREISVVQSNSFALKTTRTDGKVVDSWCSFPKKDQVVFNGGDCISILEEDNSKVLTYTFQ